MITHLQIASFKSLENVELELGQVNVFIGANGSGKSNLLEAIGVLGAAAFGRVDDESLLRRGVRPGVPKLYKSAFPHKPHERRPHIFFGARKEDAAYEVALFNPLNDPKPAWRYMSENFEGPTGKIVGRSPFKKQELGPGKGLNPEQGYAALKSVELKPGDSALDLLDGLRNYCIYSANTATLRGLAPDQQQREPVGLSGGRLPEAVLELLQSRRKEGHAWLNDKVAEILPLIDWAKTFGSGPSSAMPLSPSAAASKYVVRFTDRYMADKRNILTGYDASEGALYVLFAAVIALHPKSPSFFAVDNLDQAINPRLAKRLTQAFCSWILDSQTSRQVILTAHNAAVLDGLPLKDDRVRLFSVDRDNLGHTVARRIILSEKLLAKAAQGWTLSRLWMNGLIGGVSTTL
ncbi:MAG: AAA family ATPase [Elusimicrobia bacterium]|nr:AAA family ATPase [Elusimicrobiota bacterium]